MAIRKEQNGTYTVDFSGGSDLLGNRIRKRKKGIKTKEEAKEIERALEKQYNDSPIRVSNLNKNSTFNECYASYISECESLVKCNKMEESTLRIKKSIFDNHILDKTKNLKISSTSEEHIQLIHNLWVDYISPITNKGLSNQTLIKNHKQLTAFLNWCLKKKIIMYNPASQVGNFQKEKKEQVYLTIDDYYKLMSVINNIRDKFIISLLFIGGLRVGEVLGIKKESIYIDSKDVSNSYVNIEEIYSEGEMKNRTKTIESTDKVFLEEVCISLYLEYINYYDKFDWYNESVYLFPSKSTNKSISDSTVRNMLNKYLKEVDLDTNITPHKLRHGCAALMIYMGKELEDIKTRLRHTNIRTTSNEYGHMYEDRKKSTASDLGSFIRNYQR